MKRLLLIAMAIAVGLLPSLGHAAGPNTQITATNCTLGDETLSFDTTNSEWVGTSEVACGTTSYAGIAMSFALFRPTGANTAQSGIITGSPVMATSNGALPTPSATIGCAACSAYHASASAVTLAPGFYVMQSNAEITIVVGTRVTKRSATHSNCFVVLGDGQAPLPSTKGVGCSN